MMYYEEEELPVIMMEFSFAPDITDELMVIYFDFDYQIISVSHESLEYRKLCAPGNARGVLMKYC